jgi:hypothetical protein
LVFTPNLLQQPREWAPSDHSSGSYFRVKTSVAIQTAPSLPQLEKLHRFVVNSLLVETSSTQVYTESTPAPSTSRGKMTIAVKARSIHRARELAVELQGWSSSSLREVLLTCGVWEEGRRPLAPDKPRILTVWGDPLENGSLPLGTNQEESSNTFVTWIRALLDKHRIQRDGVGGELETDPTLPKMERMNQEQALSLVKRLTEWLERGMQDSENKICNWGPQANSCEKGDTSLTSLNLSKEQLMETRWKAGRTLGRCWERLSRAGVVEKSTSLCLPNPLPLDFSIEYHLDKCKDQLNL